MQTCSEDTHPCWFFCILGFASILLELRAGENTVDSMECSWLQGCRASTVCASTPPSLSYGAYGIYSPRALSSETHVSEVKDSRAPVFLTRIQGESLLFNVTVLFKEPGTKLEEISWGFGPESNYTVMLEVNVVQEDKQKWISLQDKYEKRAYISNVTSLRIKNLTHDDSGQYRARVRFPGGKEFSQVFHLTVYEPVPLPQILVNSQSITSDWCNITLECTPIRATQDLNVTWRSSGPPRELDEIRTLGPATISWSLRMKLPLTQTNISLTCVVSNPMDQKNATTNLGEVCDHRAGLEEDHQDHNEDIYYAELTEQEPQEGRDKGISEEHLEEKELLNSIYDEVHKPGQARP